jgi:hypothetical protein
VARRDALVHLLPPSLIARLFTRPAPTPPASAPSSASVFALLRPAQAAGAGALARASGGGGGGGGGGGAAGGPTLNGWVELAPDEPPPPSVLTLLADAADADDADEPTAALAAGVDARALLRSGVDAVDYLHYAAQHRAFGALALPPPAYPPAPPPSRAAAEPPRAPAAAAGRAPAAEAMAPPPPRPPRDAAAAELGPPVWRLPGGGLTAGYARVGRGGRVMFHATAGRGARAHPALEFPLSGGRGRAAGGACGGGGGGGGGVARVDGALAAQIVASGRLPDRLSHAERPCEFAQMQATVDALWRCAAAAGTARL